MKANVKTQNEKNKEYIEFVRQKMLDKKWNQSKLSKESGVSEGVISKFFNQDGISHRNLFAVLDTLGLLQEKVQGQQTDIHLLILGLQKQFDSMQKQIDGLQKQIDIQLVGIRSLEDSKKQIKTDISSINNRLFEVANTGELKKLGQIGGA